jgi:hypothetical protein
MICRKVTYQGNFTSEVASSIYDITRKSEITGEVKLLNPKLIELKLEGDPSVIKLIQHQIERKVKEHIKEKTVTSIPFQYFKGLTFLC